MLKAGITLNVFLTLAACSLARGASTGNSVAPGYVGDAACRPCHEEQVDTYLRTAHHLTSQPANQNSILGKFTEGENILKTSNPELFYRMETSQRGQFQTAVMGIPPDTTSRTERFDLVIGSGGKGQTYLYWKGEELFQLPVTYWTELGQWVNSPGYRGRCPRLQPARSTSMSRLPRHLFRVACPSPESLSQPRLRAGYFVREVSRRGPRPRGPANFRRAGGVPADHRQPGQAVARSSDRPLRALPRRYW